MKKEKAEKPTPYQKIVRAAEHGVGVRLTFDECFFLSADTAIVDRAMLDDQNRNSLDDDFPETGTQGEP